MSPSPTSNDKATPGNLTPEQQSAIQQLSEELQTLSEFSPMPANVNENYLLPFLRAQNFNVSKAKDMMTQAQKKRAEYGAEELYRSFELQPEQQRIVTEMFPQFFHKCDKAGRPLYVMSPGVSDPKALLEVVSEDDLSKNFVTTIERVIRDKYPACAKARGDSLIDSTFIIIDMEHAGLKQFWGLKRPMKAIIDYSQTIYPKSTGSSTPLVRQYDLEGLEELADRSKVSVHGTDYVKTLRELVDEDCIPNYLGGKCPDCQDCKTSNAGPWNHEGPTGVATGT